MIIGKIYSFDAAHFLPKVADDHPCIKVHGHSYKVEVLIDGPVDKMGMVMDFHELDTICLPAIERLDHSTLNDHILNPTAENIASFLYREWDNLLPLAGVKVWETETSFAQYTFADYQIEYGQTEQGPDNGHT